MKRILVAVDGSDHSKKALLEAKNIAVHLDADVVLINVMPEVIAHPYTVMIYDNISTKDYNDNSKGLEEKILKNLIETAKTILDNSLELFVDFPRQVKTILAKGNPAEKIIEEAEKNDYDLIVMGSRGLGTFSRITIGSISDKVVNHVHTNVLIVK